MLDRNYKLFACKLLWLLPIVVLTALPVLVLFRSGELMSTNKIISQQQKNKNLVGLAYSEPNPQYKFLSAKALKPKILALGTSRVMQFHDYFFTGSFYNAGGGVGQVADYQTFIQGLPQDSLPKVLIVGLDQYFFNPGWDKLETAPVKFGIIKSLLTPYPFSETYPSYDQNIVFESLTDIVSGKVNAAKILFYNGPSVGIQAIVNGDGYEPDGSYLYAKEIHKNDPARFNNVFDRINAGKAKFEYGDEVNLNEVAKLKNFLDYAKSKNIYVVGFLPPYAGVALDKMESTGKYGYLEKLPSDLAPLFSQDRYPFFNFTDIASVGSNDTEAIDGFHGGDVTYLRLLIKMAEQDKTLQQYTNIENLKELLQNRKNNFIVKP